MAQAKRDENSITAGLASDGSTTKNLKVDPSTGRLLVEITNTTSGGSGCKRIKRDENSVTVSAAVTDDANEDVCALLAEPSDNSLKVDIHT